MLPPIISERFNNFPPWLGDTQKGYMHSDFSLNIDIPLFGNNTSGNIFLNLSTRDYDLSSTSNTSHWKQRGELLKTE